MANGRVIINAPDELHVALLEDQSATGSGPWVEVDGGFSVWSFAVDAGDTLEEGASDATIDIMVTNQETKPDSSVDGPIALTLSTSTMGGTIVGSYKYCKAKKTAGSTPVAVTVLGRFTRASSR